MSYRIRSRLFIFQIGKKEVKAKAVMIGKKCGVEHFRISQDDICTAS